MELLENRVLLSVDVLSYHNDSASTGQNTSETTLTLNNVRPGQFGRLFSYKVDGAVFTQPLIKTGVSIPRKGVRDIVIVATEHDSVYAFDANSGAGKNASPLWRRSFINPRLGITTVPARDTLSDDITPEVGITGTPVIDPSSNTLYVVAKTRELGGRKGKTVRYVQRLHALDLSTGREKFGGPVVISASVRGTGHGNNGKGSVPFNPLRENQRPALALVNGVVYISWASHGDNFPFHGWVIGYDAQSLRQVAVWNSTPNGGLGGIWMSGGTISADDNGDLFFLTGNGTFTANTGGTDYGDAVIHMTTSGGLNVADYFTPSNQNDLQNHDADLGSGGMLLLPDQGGAHVHEAVFGSKRGSIYLVDRDNLGQYNATFDNVVQRIDGAILGNFATPAYFNDTVYFAGSTDALKAFSLTNGLLSTAPISQTAASFEFPGVTPSISANGASNGIVWVIENSSPAVLRAYDAGNLGRELYDSSQRRGDAPGPGNKFAVPTIANGKVYVATRGGLSVYGLLPRGTPAVPATLKANATTAGHIRLVWADNALNEDGYRIERSTDGVHFRTIDTAPRNADYYLDTTVRPGKVYHYRVRAINASGASRPSNLSVTKALAQPDGTPVAPMTESATARSASSLELTWIDRSTNERGFRIERSADGHGSPFVSVATVRPNVTHYLDSDLLDGTHYVYRIVAYNANGSSRYAGTFAATTPIADGEVAHWDFDEGSGLVLHDSSGNAHNANIVGEVTRVDGQLGRMALAFRGLSDELSYLTVPDSAALRFGRTDSFAISTWVKPIPNGSPMAIVSKATDGGAFYDLYVDASGKFAFAGPAGVIAGGSANGRWQHVVAMQDGTANLRWLYVDGKQVAAGAADDGSGSGDLWIADAKGAGEPYRGQIDDVRIYGRTLIGGELLALRDNAKPVAPTGLVARAASGTQIDLTWSDNSWNESVFSIEESSDGHVWQLIGSAPANARTYRVEGLSPGHSYYFRVHATNGYGDSAPTDPYNVQTP